MNRGYSGHVVAVCSDDRHAFSKFEKSSIRLLAGLGVEGDAHMGEKVQHRSRVRANPDQPNLRQVHLIHQELFEEVGEKGFSVTVGDLGENITTKDIDLLSLPRGAILHIGPDAEVEITGLRNPCAQIENWQKGLLAAVLDKSEAGNLIRKTGIMGIVLNGGVVRAGDRIEVSLPAKPWATLERV